MNLKPLGDRVVVKPVAKEEITSSGIILPETVDKDQKAEGEIIAIGSGEKISKLGLQVGQKVVYSQYGGSDVTIEKQDYKILSDDDLLAVIEK